MLATTTQSRPRHDAAPGRQAVLYARVSSKEQERGGFSIPAQQKLLRQYACRHGLNLAAEFIDVETAGRAGRDGFERMLQFLGGNPASRRILVEKTDRLYRNLRDWVTLDELAVEVHLVKEGAVLSNESVSSAPIFARGITVRSCKGRRPSTDATATRTAAGGRRAN